MKEIVNRTCKPLKVPLPGGKMLHLGPGRLGQVSNQAVESEAFRRLVDRGSIEVVGGGPGSGVSAEKGADRVAASTHGHPQPTVVLTSGNR